MLKVKAPPPWGKKVHAVHQNGKKTLCKKLIQKVNGWEETSDPMTCRVCQAIYMGKGAVLNDSGEKVDQANR